VSSPAIGCTQRGESWIPLRPTKSGSRLLQSRGESAAAWWRYLTMMVSPCDSQLARRPRCISRGEGRVSAAGPLSGQSPLRDVSPRADQQRRPAVGVDVAPACKRHGDVRSGGWLSNASACSCARCERAPERGSRSQSRQNRWATRAKSSDAAARSSADIQAARARRCANSRGNSSSHASSSSTCNHADARTRRVGASPLEPRELTGCPERVPPCANLHVALRWCRSRPTSNRRNCLQIATSKVWSGLGPHHSHCDDLLSWRHEPTPWNIRVCSDFLARASRRGDSNPGPIDYEI
jgi:hypothetical protein